MEPVLWMVVPCYNEEEVLPSTAPRFLAALEAMVADGLVAKKSRILFVDDGSSDGTWTAICELASSSPHVLGMALSRNRGHQNALLAGLMEARGHCDMAISLDCDGQDDVLAARSMVEAWDGGSEVVYGVRSSRKTDSAFKRLTAEGFYRLMEAMGAEVVFNHADYRLLGSQALDALAQFGESNLFLRGLVPMLGYPSSIVEYERAKRTAGESHYPLSKMLHLAFDGATSLSVKPIRIVTMLGFAFSLLGVAGVAWALASLALGSAVAGWASTVCLVSLLGGLQLLGLGVIGEYVGKIYLEVKGRPRYIVAKRTWDPANQRRRSKGSAACAEEPDGAASA